MADGEVKGKNETLTGIDQKTVNQKDLLQMKTEVMPPEMIEMNKGILDVVKRGISEETAW